MTRGNFDNAPRRLVLLVPRSALTLRKPWRQAHFERGAPQEIISIGAREGPEP
jgi:hypothetical protein